MSPLAIVVAGLALFSPVALRSATVQSCDAGNPCPPAAFRGRRYDGRFTLRYRQLRCRQAPCPPGGWAILPAREQDRFPAPLLVRRFVYAPGTPARLRLKPATGAVTIDGVVEIGVDGSTATIRPRTAHFGNLPIR